MTRVLVTLVAATALAACGSSAAAPSSSVPSTTSATTAAGRCGPTSARTLAASPAARVYSTGGTVYLCAPGSSHHYRLGSASECMRSARIGPAAAAGGVVAYGAASCGVDFGSSKMAVRRASDGHVLFSHAANLAAAAPESYGSVGSIVVTSSGGVAWIGVQHSIVAHRVQAQVIARPSAGSVRVLQTSPSIVPGSLRRKGSTLTWRAGSTTRSASLG